MEKVTVKQYSAELKRQVIELILSIQQGEFQIPITAEDQPDLADIPAFYQSSLGNFWVASCDGQVVGTIALLDIGDHQAALRKMFVKPAYRGSGYSTARLLLAALLDWAQRHGIGEIYLGTTEKFLAAHRFYEKHGFVQIPKDGLPKAFPVMKVDTKFYKYVV